METKIIREPKIAKATTGPKVAREPKVAKATPAPPAPAEPKAPAEPPVYNSEYICLLGEIHFPLVKPKDPIAAARLEQELVNPVTKSAVVYISHLINPDRIIVINQDGYNHPVAVSDIPSIVASLKAQNATFDFKEIHPDKGTGLDLADYGQAAFAKINQYVTSNPVRAVRYSKVMAYFRSVVTD
jgi:hypothetical protein